MATLNLFTYKSLVSAGSLRASRLVVKCILKSEITDLLLQNKQITHHSTISGVVKWLPPNEGAGTKAYLPENTHDAIAAVHGQPPLLSECW